MKKENNFKIKIAYVITRLDWGGPPDILRIILKNLEKERYDITLIYGFTKFPTPKTVLFLKEFSGKLIYIPQLRREVNFLNDFIVFLKLFILFLKNHFTIVHTNTAKAGALGRLAAYLASVPIIIHTSHGHNFYGYFSPFISYIVVLIERLLSTITTKLIIFTELERKDILRFRVATNKKICLIPPTIENEFYEISLKEKIEMKNNLSIKEDEEVVGVISRLEPVKGVEYFIEAAALVSKKIQSVKFLIVGQGSLYNLLLAKVEKFNLNEKVIFTGWRQDIQKLIYIFDIFVLASLNEAAGIVLIEAQRAGIPIIATAVGGIPEMVLEEKTAILVPPANSKALAEAIIKLLIDKEKRLKMSKFAIKWAKEKFDINSMINKTKELYQNLLQSYLNN